MSSFHKEKSTAKREGNLSYIKNSQPTDLPFNKAAAISRPSTSPKAGQLKPSASLEEHFQTHTLTDDQSKAVRIISDFLESETDQVLILLGAAGTGKTFLTKGITDFLKLKDRRFELMAPTGKAAEVLASKADEEATTIHRKIFNNDGTKTEYIQPDISQVKQVFNGTTVICDEASMVSDTTADFSKSYESLLEALMKYVNLEWASNKIIFIGDPAQLPPVKSKLSLALQPSHITNKYGVPCKLTELHEVVRQKKDSGILKVAQAIRSMQFGGACTTPSQLYGDMLRTYPLHDVKAISANYCLDQYLKLNPRSTDDNAIVVAHSNKKVAKYNQSIRQAYFPNSQKNTIFVGDKILAIQNRYSKECDIFNGDIGYITEIHGEPELISVPVKNREKGCITVDLSFLDVTAKFKGSKDKLRIVCTKIIMNVLFSEVPKLTKEQVLALHTLFRMRTIDCTNPLDLEEARVSDSYLNALHVKFGYAITCHKAQGSSWKHVFVDTNVSASIKDKVEALRWHYTAVTRAEETLYLIGV